MTRAQIYCSDLARRQLQSTEFWNQLQDILRNQMTRFDIIWCKSVSTDTNMLKIDLSTYPLSGIAAQLCIFAFYTFRSSLEHLHQSGYD